MNIRESIRIVEADPVDFSAFKKARDAKAQPDATVPDSLRYLSAVEKQKGKDEPVSSVSDYLRSLVLRNIDAAFGKGEWDADDLKTLRVFTKFWYSQSQAEMRPLVQKALKLAGARDHVKYFVSAPNPRQAYLDDDPSLATYNLTSRPKRTTEIFKNEEEQFCHVLKTMIDPHDPAWSADELTKITEYVAKVEQARADLKPGAWDVADEPQDFHPDKVPMWHDQPDKLTMMPSVEKFLKQYDYMREDEPQYWIGYSIGYNDATPYMEFSSRYEPSRKIKFADLRALERWVNMHRSSIQRWAQLQQTEGAKLSLRLVPKLTRNLVSMFRSILTSRERGVPMDETKIEAWVDHFRDATWSIQPEKLRDLFQSCAYDIKNPKLREYITDFHLTWLPEQVAAILKDPA